MKNICLNVQWKPNKVIKKRSSRKCANLFLLRLFVLWNTQDNSSSPRSISIVQLNTLLCLHLRPIKLVVYKWPYIKQKALPFGKTHVYKRYQVPIKNRTKSIRNEAQEFSELELTKDSSSSPRSISIVQLNTLLCVHPRPIKLVVYKWP